MYVNCGSELIKTLALIAGAHKVLQYTLVYSIYCKTVQDSACLLLICFYSYFGTSWLRHFCTSWDCIWASCIQACLLPWSNNLKLGYQCSRGDSLLFFNLKTLNAISVLWTTPALLCSAAEMEGAVFLEGEAWHTKIKALLSDLTTTCPLFSVLLSEISLQCSKQCRLLIQSLVCRRT